MKKHLAEQSTLFVSVLEWAALASIVGVAVGISTALFLVRSKLSTDYVGQYQYSYLLLPLALYLSNLVAVKIDEEAAGEGLDKVIDSVTSSSYGNRCVSW